MAPNDRRGQSSSSNKFPQNNAKQNKKDLKFADKESKVPKVVYGSIENVQGEQHDGTHLKRQSSISEDDVSGADDEDANNRELTYWDLLNKNSRFRLYITSYVVNLLGEWLTYLASLSAIEEILAERGESSTSKLAISALIVIRLLPNVLLCPFGGVLADRFDRRKSMMILDSLEACVSFLFVAAIMYRSISLIYLATFLQEALAGIYEPNRSAIIPLLTRNEEELQKATTLAGFAWSFMAAFGSAAGGFFVSMLGIQSCYMIDGVTYLVSVLLMSMVSGQYSVAKKSADDGSYVTANSLISQGIEYIVTSFFGPLVFLKFSAASVYGAADVLNVSFSDRGPVELRSTRLGILFASVGVGCLISPMLTDRFASMSDPRTIQRLALIGLALVSSGMLITGFLDQFWLICIFTGVRGLGQSLTFINSTMLLQKFTLPAMLGRVTSIEYSATLFAEGYSAVLAGWMQDELEMSAEQVSACLGLFGLVIVSLWLVYDYNGGGAAVYEEEEETSSTSSTGAESKSQESYDDDDDGDDEDTVDLEAPNELSTLLIV